MEIKVQDSDHQRLLLSISNRYEQGWANISAYVNTEIVSAYWQIGQYIVEFEQGGSSKAGYGKSLLENLSKDLISKFGKGFSRSNLNYMRLFYQLFPICEELPHKLSWTHFCELVKISDPLERSFYMQQSLLENWSTTELKRQKKSSLFLRLAASKDKEGILRLAKPQHSAGKRVGRFQVDSEKTQRKPWPATPATLALIQKGLCKSDLASLTLASFKVMPTPVMPNMASLTMASVKVMPAPVMPKLTRSEKMDKAKPIRF